jgi:predicted HicB family RNase H-like nuclease
MSPRVSFRVTPGVRERAAIIAEREGKTISQLAREALEARVRAS